MCIKDPCTYYAMTRPGRVRNERLQELQRLVDLTELSDDPKAFLTARDIITEGYRQGIGIDEEFTQHEVIGEVFSQWLIPQPAKRCVAVDWRCEPEEGETAFVSRSALEACTR